MNDELVPIRLTCPLKSESNDTVNVVLLDWFAVKVSLPVYPLDVDIVSVALFTVGIDGVPLIEL